jgi:hypothetical protein
VRVRREQVIHEHAALTASIAAMSAGIAGLE